MSRLPGPLLALVDGDLERAVDVGGISELGPVLCGLPLCNQLQDNGFESFWEICWKGSGTEFDTSVKIMGLLTIRLVGM